MPDRELVRAFPRTSADKSTQARPRLRRYALCGSSSWRLQNQSIRDHRTHRYWYFDPPNPPLSTALVSWRPGWSSGGIGSQSSASTRQLPTSPDVHTHSSSGTQIFSEDSEARSYILGGLSMDSHFSRPRQRIVELPDVAEEFEEPAMPDFQLPNGYRPGWESESQRDLLLTSNRIIELKSRFGQHVKRYSPWQLLGDQTQEVWQYVASPLSKHAAITPPEYGGAHQDRKSARGTVPGSRAVCREKHSHATRVG